MPRVETLFIHNVLSGTMVLESEFPMQSYLVLEPGEAECLKHKRVH